MTEKQKRSRWSFKDEASQLGVWLKLSAAAKK
jgi:hypothetical protein